MLSYTAKRLAQTIFVLLGISLITFILLQVVPGDPVAMMLEKRADPETIAKVRHELGLDLPYHVQYLNFLKGAVRFDFGTSYFTKEVVSDALFRCFKVTVKLACMSFAFAAVIGIPCGIFSAVQRGKGIDTAVMILSIVGVSAPAFWVAIILQIYVGLRFDIFPVSGVKSPIGYVLPSAALGVRYAASIARITRASMLEVTGQDFVKTAYAKGLYSWRIILIHIFQNALVPIITVIGTDIGALLTGSMITENVFNIPGIGKLLIDAIHRRDIPLVQGGVIYVAAICVLIYFIVDILYAVINPNIRLTKGE